MSCPICGANCKCKNRGAGGICCSCHRHKVRRILVTRESGQADPIFERSFDQHLEWKKRADDAQRREDFGPNGDATTPGFFKSGAE